MPSTSPKNELHNWTQRDGFKFGTQELSAQLFRLQRDGFKIGT